MGIADRFFKRSQSAAAAAAAAAMANAKFKIGDEVKDQSTGRFGRVRDIDYDGINKRLIYTIETPGSGKMNVAEDDLQLNQVQFPPAFQWGDEVQGVDNPGGNVQEPAAPTKDSLSDRIYDITQNGQPEAYEGELQQLLEQWKQVVGTPQPRFLGGSKSFGIVNRFRKAQQSDLRKPGDQVLFEYHCLESAKSCDAELWYRSHQPVEIIEGPLYDGNPVTPEIAEEWGPSMADRGPHGVVFYYTVKFADGYTHTAMEDELMDSEDQYERPDPPQKPE